MSALPKPSTTSCPATTRTPCSDGRPLPPNGQSTALPSSRVSPHPSRLESTMDLSITGDPVPVYRHSGHRAEHLSGGMTNCKTLCDCPAAWRRPPPHHPGGHPRAQPRPHLMTRTAPRALACPNTALANALREQLRHPTKEAARLITEEEFEARRQPLPYQLSCGQRQRPCARTIGYRSPLHRRRRRSKRGSCAHEIH